MSSESKQRRDDSQGFLVRLPGWRPRRLPASQDVTDGGGGGGGGVGGAAWSICASLPAMPTKTESQRWGVSGGLLVFVG